jgi:hypothetical protein
MAPAVALIVVALEIAGGGLLVAGVCVWLGATVLAVLLVAFNGALALNLLRGRRNLDCQCYGRGTVRIGWGHVVQNTVMLSIAALIGLGSPSPEAIVAPGRSLILLAGSYTAVLFLAAQELAGVRASLVRMLSRVETE